MSANAMTDIAMSCGCPFYMREWFRCRFQVKQELQRQMIRVIKANNNYIGDSKLYIEGPLNPIPGVQGERLYKRGLKVSTNAIN